MPPAQNPVIIADYRYFLVGGAHLDSQPGRGLRLVHQRRVVYLPRQQLPLQMHTPISTEMRTYTSLDGTKVAVNNPTRAEERYGELLTATPKPQIRRFRQNRWKPYPSVAERTSATGTAVHHIKRHIITLVVGSGSPALEVGNMDIEGEVARNYERRAQRMRASVQLYPDDDNAGREKEEDVYGRGSSEKEMHEDDQPYDPNHAAATANYLRCIQWLRNVPLRAPPDVDHL